MSLQTTL